MALTRRQALFVLEYAVDRNGTQAAIRAGYSPEGAGATAARLLAKVSVSRAVAKKLAQQEKRLQVDAGRVLTEYARIGLADARQAFGPDGKLLHLRDMPEDLARAVASFEVDTTEKEGGQVVTRLAKVKFHPKVAALEALGKHLQLFVERVELGAEGGPVTISITRNVRPEGGK